MAKVYDPIMCMMVEQRTNDAPSKGHEVVMLTENYLRSIGKNNSTGKYDRVVQGVRSLLSQGYLEGEELKKAVKQEADRLLKKYNANDSRTCDASFDAKKVAEYLWTWKDPRAMNGGGSQIMNILEGMYSGPKDRDSFNKFCKENYMRVLNECYSKLKSEVNSVLQEGYKNIDNMFSSFR